MAQFDGRTLHERQQFCHLVLARYQSDLTIPVYCRGTVGGIRRTVVEQ